MAAAAVMRAGAHAPYRTNSRGELLRDGRPTGYGVQSSRATRSEIQMLADMLNAAGPTATPQTLEAEWLKRCEAQAMEARHAA